jgi:hypothetical protein
MLSQLTLLIDSEFSIRIADFGTIVCLTFDPICLNNRGIWPIDGTKSNRAGCACNNEQRAVVPISNSSV